MLVPAGHDTAQGNTTNTCAESSAQRALQDQHSPSPLLTALQRARSDTRSPSVRPGTGDVGHGSANKAARAPRRGGGGVGAGLFPCGTNPTAALTDVVRNVPYSAGRELQIASQIIAPRAAPVTRTLSRSLAGAGVAAVAARHLSPVRRARSRADSHLQSAGDVAEGGSPASPSAEPPSAPHQRRAKAMPAGCLRVPRRLWL